MDYANIPENDLQPSGCFVPSLLEKGKTGVIKGFVSSKTGKTFDAALTLAEKATGKLAFEFPKTDKK